MSLADYIASARKSVVRVETSGGGGSGIVLRPSTVLTNEHVVTGESFVAVMDDSNIRLAGRVFWRDKILDLAVISVPGAHWPAMELADLSRVREGDDVIAVGHPLGLSFSVTRGIISARSREYAGQTYIQTDTAINPGNSGGPLLDVKGRLVGINTFILRGAEGLNFAIPIDRAIASISVLQEGTSRPNDLSCYACMSTVSGDELYCPICGVATKAFEAPTSSAKPAPERAAVSNSMAAECPSCNTPCYLANTYCHICGKDLRN